MHYLFVFRDTKKGFWRDALVCFFGFSVGICVNLISHSITFLIAVLVCAVCYKSMKYDSRSLDELKQYVAVDSMFGSIMCASFINPEYVVSQVQCLLGPLLAFMFFVVYNHYKLSVVGHVYRMNRAFSIFLSAALSSLLAVVTSLITVLLLSRAGILHVCLEFVIY